MTILPTTVNPHNLQMYHQTVEALCQQELGRLPAWEGEDTVGGILLEQA